MTVSHYIALLSHHLQVKCQSPHLCLFLMDWEVLIFWSAQQIVSEAFFWRSWQMMLPLWKRGRKKNMLPSQFPLLFHCDWFSCGGMVTGRWSYIPFSSSQSLPSRDSIKFLSSSIYASRTLFGFTCERRPWWVRVSISDPHSNATKSVCGCTKHCRLPYIAFMGNTRIGVIS